MLRVLITDNIHIFALLPAHALAPITQLLDRTAHLHAARLLVLQPQAAQSSDYICEAVLTECRALCERGAVY